MDLGLQDAGVFIAGASRGIGYAIAESFLTEGARVMMTARSPKPLLEAADVLRRRFGDGRVFTHAGDMTKSDEISAALKMSVEAFGGLKIAVANVGLDRTPLGPEVSDDQWASGLNQNLSSAFRLAREALKHLKGTDGGNIVMISSIAGLGALGTPITYGTAKAAMNHLAKELAKHVGPTGVRINVVAPGNIMFPGGDWEARVAERPDPWNRWIRREVPLQRFGRPEEIANAVAFIASDRASFMTGAVVAVDGGQTR